jgi:transglutaminase-like putative cysteine protease
MKHFCCCIWLILIAAMPDSMAGHIRSDTYVNVIDTVLGYSEQVSIRGTTPEKDEEIYIFYDKELQQVDNIVVSYTDERGKKKILRPSEIIHTMVETSSFFSALAGYKFTIPAHVSYQYSYTRKSKELMLWCDVLSEGDEHADSVFVKVRVPNPYSFLFDRTAVDSTVSMDSAVYNGSVEYNFVRISKKDLKRKSIRAIVLLSGVKNPWSYFNDWYLGLLKDRSYCTPEMAKKAEDLSADKANNKDSIISSIFNFVRNDVKYISVENGLGAFQPRKPDFVFDKHEGDCKDMANLLCRMLRSKNIDAYMALSATSHHRNDLDFPALSSANHAICVVKKDTGWLYLDATNECVTYGLQPDYIEGRHLFIVGYQNGLQHEVPKTTPQQNHVKITYDIIQQEEGYLGNLQMTCTGNAADHFGCYHHDRSEYDFSEWLNRFFEEEFIAGKIEEVTYSFSEGSFTTHVKLTLPPGVVDSVGGITIFDFPLLLPVFGPAEFITGSTPSFSITVDCETALHLASPLSVSSGRAEVKEPGCSLKLSIAPDKNTVFFKENLLINAEKLDKKATIRTLNVKTSKKINDALTNH